MTQAENGTKDVFLFLIVPMLVVIGLTGVVAFAPIWTANLWPVRREIESRPPVLAPGAEILKDSPDDRTFEGRVQLLGTYGDMFGVLNAAFSGLAFSAIFYTLRLQLRQTRLQKDELDHMKARAKLTIDKCESMDVFHTEVPGGPTDANGNQKSFPAGYVSVVVKNEIGVTAKECVADLLKIEEEIDGVFVDIKAFKGHLRLRESLEQDYPSTYRGADIRHNAPKAFDVLSVKDESSDTDQKDPLTFIQAAIPYAKYGLLDKTLKLGKTYKFTISICSENANSITISMVVFMGNSPSSLKVKEFKFEEEDPESPAEPAKTTAPWYLRRWRRQTVALH